MEDMEHRLKTGFKLSFLQHQTEMIPPVPLQCETVKTWFDITLTPFRYRPGERRSHAVHYDGHAYATAVLGISEPEEFRGGSERFFCWVARAFPGRFQVV